MARYNTLFYCPLVFVSSNASQRVSSGAHAYRDREPDKIMSATVTLSTNGAISVSYTGNHTDQYTTGSNFYGSLLNIKGHTMSNMYYEA